MKIRYLLLLLCLSFLMGCVEAALIGMVVDQQGQNANSNETSKALTKLQYGIVFEDYWVHPETGATDQHSVWHVKVKYVKPNSEASKAGFKVGDEIIAVNDEAPWQYNWNRYLMHGDSPVTYTMIRGKTEYTAQLNPI